MPYLVQQTIASVADSDIGVITSVEATPPNKEFLVLNHEPLGLGEVPSLSIAGHNITLGVKGSTAAYIAVRVSDTQTIIQKVNNPIGAGIIGVNFGIQ
jgi:hypothetical protein